MPSTPSTEPALYTDTLARTAFFRDFEPEELQAFLPFLHPLSVQAGETIFKEGSRGDAWYVVLDGEVSVSKHPLHGPPHVLAQLGPGECFGEMALVDGSPRMASVEAVTDCLLLVLPRQRFQQLMDEAHPLAIKLLTAMARILAQRQRELTYILMDLIELEDPDAMPDPSVIDEVLRRAIF